MHILPLRILIRQLRAERECAFNMQAITIYDANSHTQRKYARCTTQRHNHAITRAMCSHRLRSEEVTDHAEITTIHGDDDDGQTSNRRVDALKGLKGRAHFDLSLNLAKQAAFFPRPFPTKRLPRVEKEKSKEGGKEGR